METTENQENQITVQDDIKWRKIEKAHRRGKVIGGLLIVAVGSLFLAKEMGAEIPVWIFTWKMLLIAMGIITAVKHKFMNPGWIILICIGGAFLLNDIYPEMHLKPFLWPVLIIMVGLFMIFKPRRKYSHEMRSYWKKWHQHNPGHRHWNKNQWHRHQGWQNSWSQHPWHDKDMEEMAGKDARNSEDFIDSINFMGGVKKNILSKKFKGGEVVNIFGGAHIDLSQADFDQPATLDITQVFGGTKLIVPANWEIKSETITICGGIEDKRPVQPNLSGEPQRVLILIGTTVFGGIEIKSFN